MQAVQAAATNVPKVFTKQVTLTNISTALIYPVRVDSEIDSAVLADADARVESLTVMLGQTVKKGQKIATLKNTDPLYDYAPIVVRAPVSGVVSAITVSQGTLVNRGQKLFQVIDPSKIKMRAEVPAQDRAKLSPGDEGVLQFDARKTKAKIIGISPWVDSVTGTSTAELRATEGLDVSPGEVGQVHFEVDEHQGILVPQSALSYDGKQAFVNVVEISKSKRVAKRVAKRVNVTTGASIDDDVEIVSGLSPEQILILRSSRFVANGADVEMEKETTKQ